MKQFILFFSFLLFTNISARSQNTNRKLATLLPANKVVKKKLKSTSLEGKILSFICLSSNNGLDHQNNISGIIIRDEYSFQAEIGKIMDGTEIYLSFEAINQYGNTPFPSYSAINLETLPKWLPTTLGADYFIELEPVDQKILFYGIDSLGAYAQSFAYRSWDDFIPALLSHDQVYYSGTYLSLREKIAELKFNSKDKKALDEKLIRKYASEGDKSRSLTKAGSEKDVLEWIWQTYAESIDISEAEGWIPLAGLEELTIASFDYGEFDNFIKGLQRYAKIYELEAPYSNSLVKLAAYDLVIIPISSITPEQEFFIKALASKTHVLIARFNSIGKLNIDSSRSDITIINIPDNNSLSQHIASQVLFGGWLADSCNQRLRYGLPEFTEMNPATLNLIDIVVEEAIAEGAMPGCQILVVKEGMVIFDKNYGYQTYDSIEAINTNTLYDLASITKVLATTQGIMKLAEDSLIKLDDPLSIHLSYLDSTNKSEITIRQIMAHQAGLYPYYPFWKRVREEAKKDTTLTGHEVQVGKSLWVSKSVADSIIQWVVESDLLADRIDTITHEQYFYSDIGFYLLKDLIERKTEQPFDQYLATTLYKPLGTSLTFNPTCFYDVGNIAPTEVDNQLRHETVRGFVHDRNAALIGGVSGQAGLFGSANDVAIMLQMQLNGGCYGGQQYFKPETIKQFISRQYVNNRRGLGWDMPGNEPDGPVSGLASKETFGHTGFTGGSIWVDPKESLIFVFLSNRVYPSVTNTKLIDLNIRTRIQDIVYRSINK